jgi:class 3 adenylate cyclase/pimeloyl-ACP methyl ester carboxylesterase
MKPSVQFAKRKDGVNIAYSIFGKGPPLINVAAWISDLVFFFEDPYFYEFWGKLSRNFRVVLYDKHGCGQSDRDRKEFTIDSEIIDLETVINHLDFKKFIVLGCSGAGPVSVAYTARHPEKVTHLILYGTYADGNQIAKKEVRSALPEFIKASWGLGSKALVDILVPEAAPEILQHFAKFQRASCSADLAAELLMLCYTMNVSNLLSSITTPTLILHRENDKASPIKQGRHLAAEIPNSLFKVLKGKIHLPWLGDTSVIIKELLDFVGIDSSTALDEGTQEDLAELAETAEQATIVFTDIVSSTDLVNRLGDAAARDIFRQHDKIIRDQIKKYSGTELQNLGDGFMLSFQSATAAIKCACAIQKEITQTLPQIPIRIGINTGEAIRREGRRPFGQAVVMASRLVSECEGGQILISDISRQLAAGAKFSFSEKGKFKLKGFDDSIKLHAVSWKE